MLETDMKEGNERVIKLQDVSGSTLKVLLSYLYTGELLPEWKSAEVIVELTNAAGEYQLEELKEFLDNVLGKVCDLDNVLPLISLAQKLSMTHAKKELLEYARKEGTASTENLLKMGKGFSG